MKPIGSVRTCRLRRISHLIDQTANIWDEAAIRRFFYPCNVDEILKIKLPSTPSADWIAWNFEKTGMLSVRIAYKLAMREKYEMGATGSNSSIEGERALWKRVWSAGVPSKVRVFAWKARALRNELRKQVALLAEADLRNTGLERLLAILDRCWNVKNNLLQAGEQISIASSVLFLTHYIEALFQIQQQQVEGDTRGKKKLDRGRNAHPVVKKPAADGRWVPPPGETLQINVDGAFIKETGGAAVGCLLRHCRDAEEVEAQACLEGIRMAGRWPDREAILE
uniref:RNase H type-1 domain-containing protein n=1 Tax=Setaria italica TaxID=4555 RepID=K3Z040_SETIT